MAHGDFENAKAVREFAESDHPNAPKLKKILDAHDASMVHRRAALKAVAEAEFSAKQLGLFVCQSARKVEAAYKKLRPNPAQERSDAIDERRSQTYAMFLAGVRQADIARHFGISPTVVGIDIRRMERRAKRLQAADQVAEAGEAQH